MRQDVLMICCIAFALFLMQSVGGYFQIKDYRKAISRVHKKGNVGIGQKKGRFFSGHIAIIACNKDGLITGGEVLDGMTFISKFHPIPSLLGEEYIGASIYDCLSAYRGLEKKYQKKHQGYIRALEALELRLKGDVQVEN